MSAWVWLKAWAMLGTIAGGSGDHSDTCTIADTVRRRQIPRSSPKSSIRLGASVLLCAAMLVSSHPALAQFTQQGSKLVGTGASNPAFEGGSVNYRTPHTDKLHITERWKLTESGKTLEVTIRAEDADTFNDPWSAIRRYRRVQQPMTEEVCAENNAHLFDYHIPVANTPDF